MSVLLSHYAEIRAGAAASSALRLKVLDGICNHFSRIRGVNGTVLLLQQASLPVL